jgi:hypothetical protein
MTLGLPTMGADNVNDSVAATPAGRTSELILSLPITVVSAAPTWQYLKMFANTGQSATPRLKSLRSRSCCAFSVRLSPDCTQQSYGQQAEQVRHYILR